MVISMLRFGEGEDIPDEYRINFKVLLLKLYSKFLLQLD